MRSVDENPSNPEWGGEERNAFFFFVFFPDLTASFLFLVGAVRAGSKQGREKKWTFYPTFPFLYIPFFLFSRKVKKGRSDT